MSVVGVIWAQGHGRAIGKCGTIPWHVPEDLAHFRDTTMGGTLIMGRRTHESLPWALPGRRTVVLTSGSIDGIETAGTLEEALVMATGEAWIAGGQRAYDEALEHPGVNLAVITYIDAYVPDADTFAPALGDEWCRIRSSGTQYSHNGTRYWKSTFIR